MELFWFDNTRVSKWYFWKGEGIAREDSPFPEVHDDE